jgi:hypothetical protein
MNFASAVNLPVLYPRHFIGARYSRHRHVDDPENHHVCFYSIYCLQRFVASEQYRSRPFNGRLTEIKRQRGKVFSVVSISVIPGENWFLDKKVDWFYSFRTNLLRSFGASCRKCIVALAICRIESTGQGVPNVHQSGATTSWK